MTIDTHMECRNALDDVEEYVKREVESETFGSISERDAKITNAVLKALAEVCGIRSESTEVEVVPVLGDLDISATIYFSIGRVCNDKIIKRKTEG